MKKEKTTGNIIPGTSVITTISCLSGSKAEEVIRKINQGRPNQTKLRSFTEWEDQHGVLMSRGTLVYEGREFPVTLKIGIQEGLFLKDQGRGNRVSIKNLTPDFIINIPFGITESWVSKVADQIIACWVVHGKNWTNRVGKICNWPYGHDPRRPVESFFSVIDGARENLSLENLAQMGCVRVTHTGQWNRPYALAAAKVGMQIVLHEFKSSGLDLSSFKDKVISEDVNIWGGYSSWIESERNLVDGEFQNIAKQSSSPFTFHLHATKKRFPNCTLASTFLLDRIGEVKLQKIFSIIADSEPERFYRLIDQQGGTHRLLEVKDDKLCYADDISFPIAQASENIFQTFMEMREVERDPSFVLPRINRLVLDTHFYMVVRGDLDSNGVVRELSGGEMYNYLTQGSDASMHYVRNERLFQLVRGIMGVEKCEFHIYPPVPTESDENQYNI